MAGFQAFNGGNPWEGMARRVWGAGWVLVFLAIANSAIANSNAGANAATRTWYAMGRIRLLPRALARVHPRYRSPHVAVTVQFVVGLVLPLWLGFQYDPITAFSLLATILVIVVILIYMIVNLSCIAYHYRFRRAEANLLVHGVVPVLGIAAFVPALLTAAGVPVFAFIARLPHPLSLSGPVAGLWMLLGVAYLAWLSTRDPQRIRDTGRVFLDEEPAGV